MEAADSLHGGWELLTGSGATFVIGYSWRVVK